jgi:hypothetical protein
MYIVTKEGYKSKVELYTNEELLMFEELSPYKCKVYPKDKKPFFAKRIEERKYLFEQKT